MDKETKGKLKTAEKCNKMKYMKFVAQHDGVRNSDEDKTDNEPSKAKKMKKTIKDTVGIEEKQEETSKSANRDSKRRDDKDHHSSESDPTSMYSELGQWQTAKLSDSSKQEKFVRLLGGMKSKKNPGDQTTGNQNVVGKLSGVCKSANRNKLWGNRKNVEKKQFASMSLNAAQSDELSAKLEEQYNDALAFKLQKIKERNRAKGLGYQEEEKQEEEKKGFHIDINKKNSVSLE